VGTGSEISYHGVPDALRESETEIRLFGKPEVHGKRRLGVALARSETVEQAREKARKAAAAISIEIS
jgi:phosphoribosylglycinamide formyltransferase 2